MPRLSDTVRATASMTVKTVEADREAAAAYEGYVTAKMICPTLTPRETVKVVPERLASALPLTTVYTARVSVVVETTDPSAKVSEDDNTQVLGKIPSLAAVLVGLVSMSLLHDTDADTGRARETATLPLPLTSAPGRHAGCNEAITALELLKEAAFCGTRAA